MADLFQCAYFAGLIDGEGYVGIRSVRTAEGDYRSYGVSLAVGNVDRRPLDLGVELWGGTVQERGATRTGKTFYNWRSAARIAVGVLRSVVPFLVIKREQALIAIALQDRINEVRRVPLSEDEHAIRRGMQIQIRELNARRYFKPTILDGECTENASI